MTATSEDLAAPAVPATASSTGGPLILAAVAVILQAAAQVFISHQFSPIQGVRYTGVSFLTASLAFAVVHLLRQRGTSRPLVNTKHVRAAMAGLNVATMIAFLSTYVSLTMIPASLSASIVASVAPVTIIMVRVAVQRRPISRADVLIVIALLILSLTVGWWLSQAKVGGDAGQLISGSGLAVVAGIGGAAVVMLSRRLARLTIDAVAVSAGRFHLTYVAAAVLLILNGQPLIASPGEFAGMAALSLFSVAVPLFLLQLAAQRADPLAVVVVGASLPSVAYLIQVMSGERFDPVAFLLIDAIVAIAVIHSVRGVRGRNG